MNNDTAIKVRNLGKCYKLGVINNGVLFRDIQTWLARKFGKENPHAKIDAKFSGKSDFWALSNLDFEIRKGDKVGIIGHNGAGKSTLLKILSQITTPTTGTIGINGKVASLLEVGTGFHQELTGRENIYMNGAILGMKKDEIDRKLDEIIEFSEIGKHIDTPVKRYSSGMYVRLAFAVAAHLDSNILIADEVLAVGDVAFQKKALGKMNELSTEHGRTVLFVSHNMGAIKSLCNRGMVLNHGNLQYFGDVNTAISEYMKSNSANQQIKKFSNDYFDLLDYYLTDSEEKRVSRDIGNDEDIFLNIKFRYKKPDRAFCIGYAVFTDFGECMYWSYQTDAPESEWINLDVGENTIRTQIPKHFFNEGTYRFQIICSLHFICWFIKPGEGPEIQLTIRGGLSESPYWYKKRNDGVCAPLLEWEKLS